MASNGWRMSVRTRLQQWAQHPFSGGSILVVLLSVAVLLSLFSDGRPWIERPRALLMLLGSIAVVVGGLVGLARWWGARVQSGKEGNE
jgi:hypothetical protein